MDNPSDIFSLCRLCLVKDQVNISIFDEQGDIRQIFLKISSCLPVKVSRDDKLPKKICDDCSNKLDLLYEFWNSSANAEKTLLSWLGQAGVKDAGSTINAVAQQIAKPAETLVKLESGIVDENSVLISPPPVNNVDNASFNDIPKEESEAPPPAKRTRRSAAVKAQINIIPESEDDDDMDTTDLPTKLEDGTEDSDGEDKDPSYTEVSGTSVNDQPGPSGVGKVGGVEAPQKVITARRRKFSRKSAQKFPLIEHRYIHDKNLDLFICQTCSAEFLNASEAKDHVKIHNQQQQRTLISCLKCPEKFTSLYDLFNHMEVHPENEDNKIPCPMCDFRAKKKSKLLEHFTECRNLNSHRCRKCNKSFNTKANFKRHMLQHEENRKLILCIICSNQYLGEKALLRHQIYMHKPDIIEDPTLLWCDICRMEFKTLNLLNYHIEKAHNRKNCTKNNNVATKKCLCDICGQGFKDSDSLKKHKISHTEERPFVCTECGKAFKHRYVLKYHQRIHTGERPYNCGYCSKNFRQWTPFKVHLRGHTGEKPYVCKLCNKGFTTNQGLKLHLKGCLDAT